MITDLHESVLESILVNLPNLLGLHVLGCPKVDHIVMLRQVSHTPLLQSLSLTTSVSCISEVGGLIIDILNRRVPVH